MQKKEDALKGVKLFVLDMDGTVYLGDQLIEGALDVYKRQPQVYPVNPSCSHHMRGKIPLYTLLSPIANTSTLLSGS